MSRTHYVDQVGLKLTVSLRPLPIDAGITGVYLPTLTVEFLFYPLDTPNGVTDSISIFTVATET